MRSFIMGSGALPLVLVRIFSALSTLTAMVGPDMLPIYEYLSTRQLHQLWSSKSKYNAQYSSPARDPQAKTAGRRRNLGVLEMHFEVPLLPRSLCTTCPCPEFESTAIFFSIPQNSFPQATSAMLYRPLHIGMNHPQLNILLCMLSSIRLQGASVEGVSLPGLFVCYESIKRGLKMFFTTRYFTFPGLIYHTLFLGFRV